MGIISYASAAAIAAVLAIIVGQHATMADVCSKVNNTEGVNLPYIPKSYQTRIEMNIVTKNTTYEFEEWLDGDRGNMRIRRYQQGGEIDDFIFNNSTGEIFVIYNNLYCLVINMTGKTDLDLLFGVDGKMVASSKQVLRFSKEFGMQYRNRTVIRGMNVDYWYSCQHWAERKAAFEVHWYFSASDWKTPYDTNLPVRAEVKGEVGDVSNPRRFHIIYDFVSFREVLMVPDTIFDTPSGVYCEKRVQRQKLPELPTIMSYTQEVLVYNPNLEVVQYGNVYYDGSQFLVKYQFRDPNTFIKPPFFNPGSMTVIHDFTTGIAYFTDDVLGNCTDRPIGADFFDTENPPIEGRPGWDVIELRSPKDLFRVDDTYQFTSMRNARGIPIHRYISLRKDYNVSGRPNMNFTFEYEMLDPKVSEVVLGKNKLNEGKNIPVQLRITNYKTLSQVDDPTFDYREVYNFYNFDTQMVPNPEDDFDQIQAYDLDVTQCYSKAERKNIMIRFLNGGVYDEYIKSEPNLFIRRVTKVLAAADLGLVNPLRFQRVRLDYDDLFIYFIFTLLDGPHPYAQFNRLTGQNRYVEGADQTANVASEIECLARCNSLLKPQCNSVAYCPGSKSGSNCLMSSSFKKDTKNPDTTHQCSVFIRPVSVVRPNSLELALETAFALLVNYVEAGLLYVPMERALPDQAGNSKIVNVTALDIEQFEVRPNVDLALTGRHLFQFNVTKSAGMKPTKPLFDSMSVDDCAEACLGNTEFDCKSFTYCYTDAVCLLSDASPREKPELIEQRGRCNMYDKTELGLFAKEPGVSRLLNANKDVQLVDTARDCAAACIASTSLACRSFDMCEFGEGLKKFCYLSASHKSDDGSKADTNLNCTHYSRSFVGDFKQEFKLASPDLSAFADTFADLNLDYCSRRCVEDYGERCNGFYYCEPYNSGNVKSSCSVQVPGVARVTKSGPAAAPSCAFYSRRYNTDGTIWVQRNENFEPGVVIGMTPLALALVTLAILIVSAIIGVAIIGLYAQLKSRSHVQMEEPGVHFTR